MSADAARDAAASLGAVLAGGPNITISKAKVTAVNTGPPKTVDLLVENRYTIQRVKYLLSYATPAVNDAVYVVTYGPGRRLVIGEEA